jgi:hypothetical protein
MYLYQSRLFLLRFFNPIIPANSDPRSQIAPGIGTGLPLTLKAIKSLSHGLPSTYVPGVINCNVVLGRECTAKEKGDFITYMMGQWLPPKEGDADMRVSIVLMVLVVALATVSADADERVAPVTDPIVKKECGSCHMVIIFCS